MVKSELYTRTGAIITLSQDETTTVTDRSTGEVIADVNTFLMRITMQDVTDRRLCEVKLNQFELEQLGALVDMLKYL